MITAALTALLLLSGCGIGAEELQRLEEASNAYLDPVDGMEGSAPGATPGAGLPTVEESRIALRALADVERAPRRLARYRREAFGTPWRDVDGNGCNQRDDVLLRDAVPGSTRVAAQGRCQHDVLAGEWLDPYSGRTLVLDDLKDRSQAQKVQIDHVVPLAEVWRSGASTWSAERRNTYANTLDVLLAVDGPTNGAKSDQDPAA